jgi:hypothetical protein
LQVETADQLLMKQIAIISGNRPGEVAHIAEIIAAQGINIDDLDVDSAGGRSTIHLRVDRPDEALHALREADYKATSEDTLLIRLEDKPGALASIAARFRDASLNVRSMHIVKREGNGVLVSLFTNDNVRAAELVRDVLAEPA